MSEQYSQAVNSRVNTGIPDVLGGEGDISSSHKVTKNSVLGKVGLIGRYMMVTSQPPPPSPSGIAGNGMPFQNICILIA